MTIIGNLIAIGVKPLVSGGGVPPSNTVAPMVGGPAIVGQSLGTTNGDWTGSPTITFTYQWYRGATPIIGATFNYYDLVEADAGNTTNITCQVTATNIFGSATATSNVVAQILDFDANEFINAASITNQTQKDACNQLVISLKGYGIWTKMRAIYPFLGGTASAHKFNLKDPRNIDAAFRLVFNGGWTHSSTGADPNGVNAYADTKFNPIAQSSSTSNFHLSAYNRELLSGNFQTYIGSAQSSNSTNYTLLIYVSREWGNIAGFGNQVPTTNLASFIGMKQINVQGSRSAKYFKNGALQTGQFTMASGFLNGNLFIAASNNNNVGPGYYSPSQLAFATIGQGFTDTEAANFYTAVQAYQTTLGRQV